MDGAFNLDSGLEDRSWGAEEEDGNPQDGEEGHGGEGTPITNIAGDVTTYQGSSKHSQTHDHHIATGSPPPPL